MEYNLLQGVIFSLGVCVWGGGYAVGNAEGEEGNSVLLSDTKGKK